ncbi:MAG: hypothetical protein IKG46_00660 [Solobacterium sp.]|nr:hypothetical protein [Solobacterium sp.]
MTEQDHRFRSRYTKISDRALYEKRLCRILNETGMVKLKEVTLDGRRFTVAERYQLGEYPELWYCYYNEDMKPENFDPENRSMTVGGRTINTVKLAVLNLESIMTEEGIVIPNHNGSFHLRPRASRWLTTLFNEPLTLDTHIWDIFLHLCREYAGADGMDDVARKAFLDSTTWTETVLSHGGFGQVIGILSVLNGTEPVEQGVEDEELLDEDGELSRLGEIRRFLTQLAKYHASSEKSDEEQFNALIQALCSMYRFGTPPADGTLAKILVPAAVANIPEFAVKKICDVYGRSFWKTWERVHEQGVKSQPMKTLMDFRPLTTNEYLDFIPDNMLLIYKSGDMEKLSPDVQAMFRRLRSWGSELEFDIEEITLRDIADIMEYAENHYYRIYTFSGFLYHTVSHLHDPDVQILWKLYRRLLHQPDLLKSASVLFDDDGKLKRQLRYCPPDMRMNTGRAAIKRFNMMLANPALLKDVMDIQLEL